MTEHAIIFPHPTPPLSATASLRWNTATGKLEQLWRVPDGIYEEWIEVPDFMPPEQQP